MGEFKPSCEPVAWIVHVQYQYVTMDPPIEGGSPRTNLYTAAQLAAEVAAERERCAQVVEALLRQHCAATQAAADHGDRCNPDDMGCDFVAAWTTAAASIRTTGEAER